MVKPQECKSQARKLEENAPGSVIVIFLSPVDLVIEEHANQSCEVSHEGGSNVDQTTLAQERPWRMANAKEDGLQDESIGLKAIVKFSSTYVILYKARPNGHRETLPIDERSSVGGRHCEDESGRVAAEMEGNDRSR